MLLRVDSYEAGILGLGNAMLYRIFADGAIFDQERRVETQVIEQERYYNFAGDIARCYCPYWGERTLRKRLSQLEKIGLLESRKVQMGKRKMKFYRALPIIINAVGKSL